MPSKRHQFIVGLLIKYMKEYGCNIKFVEGTFLSNNDERKLPPTILRHRPDIFGISNKGCICIGEAKTEIDLWTSRTKEQIIDYLNMELNDFPCEVFLGVPSNPKEKLIRMLINIGVWGAPNLHLLFVPEEIINE